MKIINRYITRDYLVVFGTTLLVLTFVMCIGAFLKAIDLVSRGLSGALVLQFFLQNIPKMLSYTIPVSTLISSLLLFSRLSADSEVIALRACGISFRQIIAPLLLVSVLFSGVCLYFTCYAGPMGSFANRKLVKGIGAGDPVALLEEGRFVEEIPGIKIYVGRKTKSRVYDVVAYELTDEGAIEKKIAAEEGFIGTDDGQRELRIDLFNVRIEVPSEENPLDPARARYINARHYPVVIKLDELFGDEVSRKRKYMSFWELQARLRGLDREIEKTGEEWAVLERSKTAVEANKQLVLGISCFTFMLVGIPLGVCSPRKESSAGIGISILVMMVFYCFLLAAKALDARPEFHPELILWLPVMLGQVAGFMMIRRLN